MSHKRMGRLRGLMQELALDAILVTGRPNTFWLTGFSGSTSMLLIGHAQAHLLVDFRYTIQARSQVTQNTTVIEIPDTFYKSLDAILDEAGYLRIGYEGSIMTVSELARMTEKMHHSPQFINLESQLDVMRKVKDAKEISLIADAVRMGDAVFLEALPLIKPGMTEAELAGEMEYRMRRLGARGPSFDTIIAGGENGALCHWSASNKKLKQGEAIVMDFGVKLNGYCSDMTRTVFLGDPQPEMRKIYNIVLKAQMEALSALQEAGNDILRSGASAGMTGSAADAVARRIIDDAGYGKCFGHSLGHGVGIEVHEEPRLSSKSEDVLGDGMVFTIEPGIYVEGLGGVRIEDMATYENGVFRNFTGSSKEMIIL